MPGSKMYSKNQFARLSLILGFKLSYVQILKSVFSPQLHKYFYGACICVCHGQGGTVLGFLTQRLQASDLRNNLHFPQSHYTTPLSSTSK